MITSAEIRNRLRQMAISAQGKLVATSFVNSISHKSGTHVDFHILRMNHPENCPCTIWATPKKIPKTLYTVIDYENDEVLMGPVSSAALANSAFILFRNKGFKVVIQRTTITERN